MPDELLGFVAELRAAGVAVPLRASSSFVEAVAVVAGEGGPGLYWAGRATLVCRPEDIAVYDDVFARHWLGGVAGVDAAGPVERNLGLDAGEGEPETPAGDPGTDDAPPLSVRYSPIEVLRHKDFATCTDAELDELRRLMASVRMAGPVRRSRRQRPTHRRRGAPDLRRTARAALRSGGEALAPGRRANTFRPRPLVLLCDVSGSMEPYSRALLHFAHAAVAGRQRVHVFTIGTRLTRLTRQLASRDPDVALRQATAAVSDWSGGTRLGEGLRSFNDDWGVRGLARGAVVVVLSDGWDRGDPQLLGNELARLRRVAHRLVWVNPLKAGAGYAPLARGMAAALPHLDAFVDGHDLAALEDLARVIAP